MYNHIIRPIIKSAATLGLMGLLVAVAAGITGTPSASAASPLPKEIGGKLSVYTYNALQAGLVGIKDSTVAVFDSKGQTVIKGSTDTQGFFSTSVQQGIYTVKVTAPG